MIVGLDTGGTGDRCVAEHHINFVNGKVCQHSVQWPLAADKTDFLWEMQRRFDYLANNGSGEGRGSYN